MNLPVNKMKNYAGWHEIRRKALRNLHFEPPAKYFADQVCPENPTNIFSVEVSNILFYGFENILPTP